jgi:hypothetical protein
MRRATESGEVGPGRKRQQQRCAYCAEPMGVFACTEEDARTLCCGDSVCEQERRREAQMFDDEIEGGAVTTYGRRR